MFALFPGGLVRYSDLSAATLYFVLKLEPVLKIFVQNLKLCSQLRQYALYTSRTLLQMNRSLNVFLLEVHYNSLKFPAQLVSLHAKLFLMRLLSCTPIVFLYKIVPHFFLRPTAVLCMSTPPSDRP